MANNQQIQDPSTKGVGGLKGLKSIDALKQEGLLRDVPHIDNIEDYKQVSNSALQRAVPQEVGFVGVGDSMYDEGITSMTQLDNLANTRGELQPWYAQIGAGLAKGAVLAGTTFADGIIGTIVGLGNAAATGTFSGFWDNPFSNTMQQVNEWSESVLPNYYTDAEKNDPWYENIFSANFIGDKFLKNLGFAVGAAYSGKISAGATSKLLGLNKARQAFKGAVTASGEALNPNAALQAYREGDLFLDGVRLTEELARDAKKLKMAEPTLKLTGAFSGALGEARIEAIQNSKDWFELHKQQLDDTQAKVAAQEQEAMLREFPQFAQYQISPDGKSFEQVLTPEGQAMLQARVDAKFDYNGGLQKLSEDRAKMGNIDFALNIPLLTVSDAWQFGKFYAGGYNTAKKGSQILRTVAEDGTVSYSAAKPSVLRNALKLASKGVAEGPYEEMGQAVAGKVAGYKYASELNDFYGAKIDPDAESETIDWLQATAKAMQQTYGTAEGWEEGFIGGLTGLVGIPGFRSTRNSEGGFQSPVYLQGGVKEDIKEIRERSEKDDAIVAQLNNRVQSPEFLNYYQSAIRHNAYQKQMDEAADNNDNFEFKNAEHNQLISDVIMFDKAGRINDLYDIIEEAGNIREEDVEQIRQLTTNQETGTSVYDNMTDAEVIEQVQKQTKETKKAVDNYRKISQDLQVKVGDYFDEDGLEEMTYYFSNIDNLENRFKSIHEDIKDRLQEVLDASMDREFISDSDENKITRLSDLLNFSPVRLINALADSKESQSYISLLDNALQTDPNKQDIIEEVKDLQKIAERRLDFIDKYDTYLRNPQALAQKQERQRENIIKENERQEIAKTKDAALAATNLNEFREALNNEADSSKRQQILDELENEGNKMAKDYKEVQMYNSEVSRAIDSQPISPEAKANAKELLRTQHENANNLEEMANPNSVFINNPESLYNENLPDDLNMMNFAEAQYGLLSAMSKVNNDQRFKARFPVEYLKPVEKTEGTRGTTAKDTTGDSGTSTVPPVNAGPVDTYEPPVGNITSQMVAEENKKANENAPTQQSLDRDSKGKRQYYRPTIPELHINASKDGDFRPFNVVVAEKENLNFDELYNYLRDNRAFSYVNEGNLKVGDELGFMIDPEFNDHTIFIVDRRNNQIVGSLDESQYSIDRYEGLADLVKRVRNEYRNVSGLQRPSYFKAMHEQLKDKESSWEYYRDDINRVYNGIEYVTGASYQSVLHPAITLAVDSGVLPRKYKKYLNRTKDDAIEKEDLEEIIAELKKLGINTPKKLLEYVTQNSEDKIDGFIATPTSKDISNYQELKNGDIVHITGFNDRLPDGSIKTERTFKVQGIGERSANLTAIDAESDIGLTNNYINNLKEQGRRVYVSSSSTKSNRFIATPTTRVSQIMVGRIPYGTGERNMGEIPNVSASSIFGIVKNGVLSTNGRISDDLIIKPMDMSQKEGRMYILIPNAAGKYSPAAVRVKHFNESEYNPEDVTINSTPLYKSIKKSIDALANAFTEEDVNNAVKDLARSLYIGDVHIDYIQGKNGNGIRFTKVQRDANKNEIYDEVDGKRVRREDARTVFLTERWDPNVIYELGGEGVKTQPDTRDSQEVASEIQNILMAFNLPLQVNLGMLNKGGYNNMLLSSGVMTSNIVDASVKSNWFTTDYFDIQGNLQQALNPASVKAEEGRKIQTPVGGTEGAIAGTTVSFDNTTYYVDLTSNTVRDNNGRTLNSFPESILDMAYIQENYGDAQNGSMMMGGITLLPNGKVLNRNTGQYLTGAESDKFKQKLAGRKKTVADSKKVIDQIAENQAKVDKTRTDGEFYYILEDDGKYHEYKRVHSVLGSNWVESPKQTKALQDLRVNLSKNADNITQFNNYLKNLSNHYGVDLTAFEGKIDARSRDTIVNIVRDKMSGTNSQRALEAGTSVDSVIRNFFTSSEMPVKPSNISEQAFNDLVTSLTEIKSNIEARGETFLTNNIVLFNKYKNGNRVAGEVDILSVDANGNFKIYDVKTSRYSFYDFIDRNGRKVNYFKNKSNTQTMSQEQYYTKQLSAYKNLFESQYHTPITTLAILPFVLEYNKDNVSRVSKEKGILLNYDSSVNIPLVGSVSTPEVNNTNSSLPIFNSTFETREPINNVLPDYSMSDSKVGYFVRDGKLHTGYLSPIGKVNGVEVYMTKVPNITKGFGNQPAHVASNDFYAVFPNGNTIALVKNAALSYSETEAKNNIKKILEGNPQRVVDMSQESTLLQNLAVSTVSAASVNTKKMLLPKLGKNVTGYLYNTENLIPVIYVKTPNNNTAQIEWDNSRKRWGMLILTSEGVRDAIMDFNMTFDTIREFVHENLDKKFTDLFESGEAEKLNNEDARDNTTKLDETLAGFDIKFTYLSMSDYNASTTVETPATINQGESNGAASTVAKEQTINQTDEEFDVEFELRQVDDLSRPVWNKDKELAWLNKVLPQLSENELVKIQEGLIEVAKTGALAWGQFSRGVITLSDIAAEGTTYHEAFHAVFNLLTDTETREALYAEARQKFGNRDNAELEELMAEDFREYVMTQEDRGLGRKLLDFFKSLFAKVTNWKSMQPSLIQYYRNINEGHYSSSDYKVSTLNNIRGRGLWHTSDNIIYKFKREFPENFFAKRGGSPRAIFFTDRVPESQSFLSKREVKSQYDVVITNPLIVEKYDRDAEGAPNMAGFVDTALQAGNDGVIFRDIYDNQMYGDVYVAFNPDQINYIAGQSGEVSTYGPIRFADMNSDVVKSLVKKGWTEEMWNSISQEEREQAIRCS